MSLFHVWEDCGYCIWEQSFPQMCVKLSLETVFSGRHCKCAYPKLFSYMKWCLCLKIPPQNSAFHSHKAHTEKGTGNMLYVKKAWREQGGKLCNDTFWGNTGRLLVLQNTRWRWDSKVSSLTYFRALSPRQILLLYDSLSILLTCALFSSWQSQLSQRRHPNWEHGFSFFPVSNTCLLQQPPWALGWKSPYHGQRRSCRLDNTSVSNWILSKDASTGTIVKHISLFRLVWSDFYKLHIIVFVFFCCKKMCLYVVVELRAHLNACRKEMFYWNLVHFLV